MSAYALAGDYEKAEAQSRDVLALRPGDKKAEKLLADILNKKQNTIQAQQIYERLAAQAGSDPSVRVRLGQVYLLQHDFTRAMDQFRLAMAAGVTGDEVDNGFIDAAAGAPESAMTPQVRVVVDRVYAEKQTEAVTDPVFLARLGWVMERFKQFDKSAGLLERAVALKPDDVDLKKQLFGVLVARGEMAKALAMFPGDQDDPGVRRMLVDAYLRAGDMPAAAREAGKLYAAEPTDAAAAELYADILSWDGRYDESLAVFEQLRRQSPADAEIPLRIAEVTLWSGRPEKALGQYQAILATRFDQPKAWAGFVDAAAGADDLTLDQFKLAVRIGRQPSVLASENPALLGRLAWVMVRENHPDMAAPFLTRAVDLKPTAAGEKRELAGVLNAAGRPADALAVYQGLDPLTPADHLRLADIHSALEQFAEAEADVQAYLAAKPGDPKGERLLADVLSWKGDFPAALAAFRHLLAVDPTNLELRIRYAETTLWSGDTAEALTLFSRLIADDPTDHRVLEGFVNAASGAPRLTDAQKALVVKVAGETDFAPKDAALLGRLAWVFHQAGLTKEATTAADRAVALNPQDPDVRKQLGGVLAAIGRFDASLQMFAELALGPKDRLELARVYAATKNFPAAEKEVRRVPRSPPRRPRGPPAARRRARLEGRVRRRPGDLSRTRRREAGRQGVAGQDRRGEPVGRPAGRGPRADRRVARSVPRPARTLAVVRRRRGRRAVADPGPTGVGRPRIPQTRRGRMDQRRPTRPPRQAAAQTRPGRRRQRRARPCRRPEAGRRRGTAGTGLGTRRARPDERRDRPVQRRRPDDRRPQDVGRAGRPGRRLRRRRGTVPDAPRRRPGRPGTDPGTGRRPRCRKTISRRRDPARRAPRTLPGRPGPGRAGRPGGARGRSDGRGTGTVRPRPGRAVRRPRRPARVRQRGVRGHGVHVRPGPAGRPARGRPRTPQVDRPDVPVPAGLGARPRATGRPGQPDPRPGHRPSAERRGREAGSRRRPGRGRPGAGSPGPVRHRHR